MKICVCVCVCVCACACERERACATATNQEEHPLLVALSAKLLQAALPDKEASGLHQVL